MVCFLIDIKPIMGTPNGLEVCMKNGLLRFYLLFMFMSLGLFSCENHEISNHWGTTQNNLQKRPDSRHPNELNEAIGVDPPHIESMICTNNKASKMEALNISNLL